MDDHICDECSIYDDPKIREVCGNDKPATKQDIEELKQEIKKTLAGYS